MNSNNYFTSQPHIRIYCMKNSIHIKSRNNQYKKYSKKEFHKKYGGNTKDYSTDYKKDYAAYLEQKAAAKAAAKNAENTESGAEE